VTAARHLQTIWLLAKGHEMAEVAATVSYAPVLILGFWAWVGKIEAWVSRAGAVEA